MSAPAVENKLSDSSLPSQIPAPEGSGTPNYTIRPKTSDSGAVEGELLPALRAIVKQAPFRHLITPGGVDRHADFTGDQQDCQHRQRGTWRG